MSWACAVAARLRRESFRRRRRPTAERAALTRHSAPARARAAEATLAPWHGPVARATAATTLGSGTGRPPTLSPGVPFGDPSVPAAAIAGAAAAARTASETAQAEACAAERRA